MSSAKSQPASAAGPSLAARLAPAVALAIVVAFHALFANAWLSLLVVGPLVLCLPSRLLTVATACYALFILAVAAYGTYLPLGVILAVPAAIVAAFALFFAATSARGSNANVGVLRYRVARRLAVWTVAAGTGAHAALLLVRGVPPLPAALYTAAGALTLAGVWRRYPERVPWKTGFANLALLVPSVVVACVLLEVGVRVLLPPPGPDSYILMPHPKAVFTLAPGTSGTHTSTRATATSSRFLCRFPTRAGVVRTSARSKLEGFAFCSWAIRTRWDTRFPTRTRLASNSRRGSGRRNRTPG
jgi:hypothetical protein